MYHSIHSLPCYHIDEDSDFAEAVSVSIAGENNQTHMASLEHLNRFVGIIIDSHLNWKLLNLQISKKIAKNLGILKKLGTSCPQISLGTAYPQIFY